MHSDTYYMILMQTQQLPKTSGAHFSSNLIGKKVCLQTSTAEFSLGLSVLSILFRDYLL